MADPVLVVPGLMADGRVFSSIITKLSHERAVQIALPRTGATVSDMARNLLLDAPAKFALIGHGLGSFVAMEILRQAPDRVVALVLLNGSALAEVPAKAALFEDHIVKARAGGLTLAMQSALGFDGLSEFGEGAKIRNLYAEMSLDLGVEVFVRQIKAIQKRPDQQRLLAEIKKPVLVIGGELDPVFSKERQVFLGSLIQSARVEILGGVGHFPMLESPARVAELIEAFLPRPFLLN